MEHTLKIYTGPTIVKEVGKLLASHGLTVSIIGTEHVYIKTEGSDINIAVSDINISLHRIAPRMMLRARLL